MMLTGVAELKTKTNVHYKQFVSTRKKKQGTSIREEVVAVCCQKYKEYEYILSEKMQSFNVKAGEFYVFAPCIVI